MVAFGLELEVAQRAAGLLETGRRLGRGVYQIVVVGLGMKTDRLE